MLSQAAGFRLGIFSSVSSRMPSNGGIPAVPWYLVPVYVANASLQRLLYWKGDRNGYYRRDLVTTSGCNEIFQANSSFTKSEHEPSTWPADEEQHP